MLHYVDMTPNSHIKLKGLTWNHTRGLAPMQVTSKAFNDRYPEVEITWEARSLWSFGEEPIENVISQYDFIMIDHPFSGAASALGILTPLEEWSEKETMRDLERQSVGRSFESYHYNGHQWALPVDAAAQVVASRDDILDREGIELPKSWEEVIKLASQTKKVAMPMGAMGLWGVFCGLCANQGEAPFSEFDNKVVSNDMGTHVLEQLRRFYAVVDPDCLKRYPPSLLRRMSETEEVWYMPFTYGYLNYCMEGFVETPLTFHDIFPNRDSGSSGATLGGVGVSITSHCQHKQVAAEYATWIAGASCQKTLYSWSGGQAGNVEAWKDPMLNKMTNNFYENTLESLEKAFVRPRYNGFHHFQTKAGKLLQSFLIEKIPEAEIIKEFNRSYCESRVKNR